MQTGNWPTFLIIGAGKAGTTSLYRYLDEHPEVFMSPKKEPNFFAFEGESLDFSGPGDEFAKNSSITDKNDYLDLFSAANGELARGEASPVYLYSDTAPERIHHYLPDVKLVAVLRQPVDRAYSAFMMMVRTGRESCQDFAQVVADLPRRQRDGWGSATLLEEGYYFKLLSRYYRHFDRSQIKVFLFEDLVGDVAGVYSELTNFIGVDPDLGPRDFRKHNVSGVPRSRWLHNMTARSNAISELGKRVLPKRVRSVLKEKIQKTNLEKRPIDPELRRKLTLHYREDIEKLQGLIDRDLSHWLQ